jgi:hypothetical protein
LNKDCTRRLLVSPLSNSPPPACAAPCDNRVSPQTTTLALHRVFYTTTSTQIFGMAPVSPVSERPNGSSSSDGPTNGFTAVNDRPSPPNGAHPDTNGRPHSSSKEAWGHANGDANLPEYSSKRRYAHDTNDPPSSTSPSRSRAPIDPEIDQQSSGSSTGSSTPERIWDPSETRMAHLLQVETGARMDMSPPDPSMKHGHGHDGSGIPKATTLVTTAAGVTQDPTKKRKRVSGALRRKSLTIIGIHESYQNRLSNMSKTKEKVRRGQTRV